MRSLALVLLVALLAGAAGWLLLEDEASVATGVVATEAPGVEAVDDRAAPSLVEPQDPEQRRTVEAAAGSTGEPEAEARQLGSQAPTKLAHFVGELVVVGEEGLPLGAFDGRIHLKGNDKSLVLEVLAGHFDGELEVNASYQEIRVKSVEVPGLELQLGDAHQSLDTDSPQPQEILVRVVPTLTLHVLDAATDAPLSEAWLVPGHNGYRAELASPHQGLGGPAWRTPSPIDLNQRPKQFDSWFDHILVGGESYAWQRLYLDLTHSGEVFVRLEPGAEVQVNVQRLPGDAALPCELVLTARGGALDGQDLRLGLGDRPESSRLVDGMTPGPYNLAVERAGGELLASQDVELVAGQNPTIVLLCAEPAKQQLAPVSILLVRPESWGPEKPAASMNAVDLGPADLGEPLDVKALGGDRWSLVHPGLPPGEYRLQLEHPSASIPLSLPPGGLLNHQVELPAPLTITLEFVDSDSGEPRPIRDFGWLCYSSPSQLGGSSYLSGHSIDNGDDGLVTLVVPPGDLRINNWGDEHLLDYGLEVHTDGQHFRVRVSALSFFSLVLTEQGRSLPTSEFATVMSVIEIDGPGDLVHIVLDPGSLKIALSATGTYTVQLNAGKTFAAAGPFEVVVPETGIPRLEIELVRLE
ncbi:MAG: hypothetical protein P1V81_11715 [Planctomycetota bacterium]|nr:hypothetical protein [Planctomycetota bacterium]